jgi:hypothetical protein
MIVFAVTVDNIRSAKFGGSVALNCIRNPFMSAN